MAEECFNLRATIATIEVEAKYGAEKEVRKLQSEVSFMVGFYLLCYIIHLVERDN